MSNFLRCRFLRGAAIGLSLLSGSALAAPGERHELTTDERAAVERAIKRQLRDPGSAQFEDVAAVADGPAIFVCGNVNAKNMYGGYVGFNPFYGRLTKEPGDQWPFFNVTTLAQDNRLALSVARACANKGLRVSR